MLMDGKTARLHAEAAKKQFERLGLSEKAAAIDPDVVEREAQERFDAEMHRFWKPVPSGIFEAHMRTVNEALSAIVTELQIMNRGRGDVDAYRRRRNRTNVA